MKIVKKLKSNNGVAIEWAVAFSLFIFALGFLLIALIQSKYSLKQYEDKHINQQMTVSQIGEYFVRACEFGSDFPKGDETDEQLASNFPWMDGDTLDFFKDCIDKGLKFDTKIYETDNGSFWDFHQKGSIIRKLTVTDASGNTVLTVAVAEEYITDESQDLIFTKSSNPKTRFSIIEWTEGESLIDESSDNKLKPLQSLWKWAGNLFGANADPQNDTRWIVYKYDINYKDNTLLESTSTCDTTTQGYVTGSNLVMPRPSCPGYSFDGWYDQNGKKIGDAGSKISESMFTGMKSGDGLTLYAHWTVNTITLKDGDWSQNHNVKCTLPEREKADYYFYGWKDESDSKSKVLRAGETVTAKKSGNTVYTAQWIKISDLLTIEYDVTGAESEQPESVLVTPDITSVTLPYASKNNCSFEGWYTEREGGEFVGNAGSKYTPGNVKGTIVLYAHFKPLEYTITYMIDGVKNPSGYPQQKYSISDTVTVLGKPSEDGKNYSDWVVLESDDESTTGWAVGSTVYSGDNGTNRSGNIVLSSTSRLFYVTVVYGNGTDNQTGSGVVKISNLNPTKAGYKFDGWKVTTGSADIKDGVITPASDCTVTAQWKGYNVTVVYGNGTADQTGSGVVTIATPNPTRAGYKFDGWKVTDGDATVKEGVITPTSDCTVTAQWTAYKVTVVYGNGTADQTGTAVVTIATPKPTKAGYKFDGWKVTSGTAEIKDGVITPTSDCTVTAQWTAYKVTVVYGNGTADQTGTAVVTIATPKPTKAGYKFDGWKVTSGTAEIKDGVITPTSDCTVTAQWTAYNVTVVYGNGTADQTGSGVVTIKTPAPTRAGYKFDGWKVTSGTATVKDGVITPTSDCTVTAQWTAYKVTVVYGNGTSDQTGSGVVTIKAPKPTRAGYKFDGWKVTSGTADVKDGVITPTSDCTVTAQWTAYKVTVVYGNGTADQTGTAVVTIKTPAPTRAGYKFDGWKVTSGTAEIKDGVITPTGDCTVTAQWTAYKVTVVYGNGTADQTGSGVVTIKTPAPTKAGYKFDGWKVTSGTATVKDGVITPTSDCTVTAQWTAYNVTVVYGNGTADQTGTAVVTIKAPKPTRAGYKFDGWKVTSGTAEIKDGVITPTSDCTVTAQWKICNVTVVYGNGTADQTGTGIVTISNPNPTKAGYKFSGWKVTDGDADISGATITPTSDCTVTAQWTAYTVTIDYNDGVTSGKIDSGVVTIPEPTRAGYKFNGWKVTDGTADVSGATITPTSDCTVTAQWTAYKVTIDYNDGVTSGTSAEGVVTITEPTKPGYKFNGWKVTSGTADVSGATITPTSDCTVTAQWTAYKVTVVYGNGIADQTGTAVVTISTPAPTMTGYTFTEWKVTSGTAEIKDGIITPTSDCTVTAQWTVNKYKITSTENNSTNTITVDGKTVDNGGEIAYGSVVTFEVSYSFGSTDKDFTLKQGDVDITYYSNAECTTASTSKDAGTYYFKMPAGEVTLASKAEYCLATGTLITLGDGTQKPIEEIDGSENIMSWNFFTGGYEARRVSIIVYHGDAEYNIVNSEFSDGTVLRTIGEHGLFDYDLNKYIYITTENFGEFIGHQFVKYNANGTYDLVTLTNAFVTTELTGAYSISSSVNSNVFAEGILTVAPPDDFYNWIEMDGKLHYNVEKFNADVEKYGTYDYDVFKDYVTYEQYVDFNGAYLKSAVEQGKFDFEYILELIALYAVYMPGTKKY